GAPTPAVDEAGAYIFFESGDLVALDHEGKTRWVRSLTKEYGDFVGGHGVGSSLVMTPTVLVLLVDHEGPSYLLGIDKETGENVWKFDRDPRVSWTTPLYLEHDGVPQIVVSSNEELASFRLADGEKLWWVDGVKRNTVASPTTNGEVVVIGSSEPLNSLAIALGGKGDVTESHLKWRAESVTSSFGSPLVVDETVFFVNRAGALQATNLTDGSLQWERRLPASTWASPLATPSRLYFFANNGQTVVFDRENLDEEAPPLATNILTVGEEDKLYGYAVSTGQIVMRTGRKLMSANSNVAKTAQTAH
ncbi:MAG: PQQ-binding-like beta-propeller repeat protein, partial [Verrucomicrobiota bacterium]